MSDLLITELAKCTTQKSGVQTCNPSNQSASDLHLGHTDHTATQPGQIVDTMILLIFVQRYRHHILCIVTVILRMNCFLDVDTLPQILC
jgi:hypothetical protein